MAQRMTLTLSRFAIGLLLALSVVSSGVAQDPIIGVASVIDGDTIEIHGQRIRLFGIDAPESGQLCVRPNGERWRCGQQGSFALSDRIGRATVNCQPRDLDRYGRFVAICFKGDEDLSRWMVLNGWAVAFRRYSLDYVADEDAARQRHINIWSGEFDMPWVWRARNRTR
jgi:endonuclease YncB( thermonuclease family)